MVMMNKARSVHINHDIIMTIITIIVIVGTIRNTIVGIIIMMIIVFVTVTSFQVPYSNISNGLYLLCFL